MQGSGNSDKSNLWSRAFAEFLAENGYYVLLPDKRGTGKSDGNWKNASFNDLATDAINSAHHLKNKMSMDQIGIMRLSQGGYIAPIAAIRDSVIDFVINIYSGYYFSFNRIILRRKISLYIFAWLGNCNYSFTDASV